jgi:kynurenine formamidase
VVGAEAPWRAPAAREDPTAPARLAREAAGREYEDLAHHVGGLAGYRTGTRAHDQEAFLNADESGPHTPGPCAECARWLAHETPIVGIGVETVGTDTGGAAAFDPRSRSTATSSGRGRPDAAREPGAAPADRGGRRRAPLKLVDGTGTPTRVLALV